MWTYAHHDNKEHQWQPGTPVCAVHCLAWGWVWARNDVASVVFSLDGLYTITLFDDGCPTIVSTSTIPSVNSPSFEHNHIPASNSVPTTNLLQFCGLQIETSTSLGLHLEHVSNPLPTRQWLPTERPYKQNELTGHLSLLYSSFLNITHCWWSPHWPVTTDASAVRATLRSGPESPILARENQSY
jgi:hypothetical protein